MILMFLSHPAAFVCCLLSFMGLYGAYDVLGYGEPGTAVALGTMLAFYFIACWVLPWWTRPIELWRWLRINNKI